MKSGTFKSDISGTFVSDTSGTFGVIYSVEGNNQRHQYTWLVYWALDADGNRLGKPLKSSLFEATFINHNSRTEWFRAG